MSRNPSAALWAAIALATPLTALAGDWDGTWNSSAGALRLREADGVVYGDYGTVGVIVGVVDPATRTLKGVYTNTTTQEKAGSFTWTASSQGFSGTWVSAAANGTWTGTRTGTGLPALNNFGPGTTGASAVEGTWESSFGALRLIDLGPIVIGDYDTKGIIYGTRSGQKVTGAFSNGANLGRFEWTLNAKNDGWTGLWKWEGEPAFQGTPWNATKKSPLPGTLSRIGAGRSWSGPPVDLSKDTDHCGPEFLQQHFPPSVGKAVQDLIAKDLRPACQTHDVCYRAKQKTQTACDMGMLKDMKAICQSTYGNSWFGIERGFCDWRAIQLYNAVMTSYGGMAYGGGQLSATVTADRVWVIDDVLTDDEVSGCVTIKNTSNRILEFDLQMLSSSGKVLDTEPDASEVNLNPNASKELCVSTNGAPESYNDVGSELTLYVRLDNPDNMSVMGDMLYVWAEKYPRPKRP